MYFFFVDFLDYSDKGMIYVTIEIVTISCVKMICCFQCNDKAGSDDLTTVTVTLRFHHRHMAFKYNHIFQYTY